MSVPPPAAAQAVESNVISLHGSSEQMPSVKERCVSRRAARGARCRSTRARGLTAVQSGASLPLVSRLRWLAAIFFALVAVLVPSRARASMTPAPETRIGDFHLASPMLVGVITAQTLGKHRAISVFVYDPASAWRYAKHGRTMARFL